MHYDNKYRSFIGIVQRFTNNINMMFKLEIPKTIFNNATTLNNVNEKTSACAKTWFSHLYGFVVPCILYRTYNDCVCYRSPRNDARRINSPLTRSSIDALTRLSRREESKGPHGVLKFISDQCWPIRAGGRSGKRSHESLLSPTAPSIILSRRVNLLSS